MLSLSTAGLQGAANLQNYASPALLTCNLKNAQRSCIEVHQVLLISTVLRICLPVVPCTLP